MLIEQQKRPERVRFRHPIRVVTVNDQPRVIRTLTGNLSREGLFLRMPEPLPMGTKVGLSLEAGGRALAFAQAEVMWQEHDEFAMPEVGRGCGVRFTEFMHPRGRELVDYLVDNLDRGRPLTLPKQRPLWARVRVPAVAAMAALFVAILGIPLLSQLLAPERPSVLSEPVEDSPVAAAPVLSEPVEDSAVAAAPSVLSEPVEDSPAAAPSVLAEAVEDSPGAAVALAPPPAEEVKPAAVAQPAAEPTLAEAPAAPAQIVEAPASPAVVGAAASLAVEVKAPQLSSTGSDRPEGTVAAKPQQPSSTGSDIPEGTVALKPQQPSSTGSDRAGGNVAAKPVQPPSTGAAKPVRLSSTGSDRTGGKAKKGAPETGTVKLPAAAAPGLAWTLTGSELRLAPELSGQARITRSFVLEGPPRVVFDVSGPTPKQSLTVNASPPYATSVRLGKQAGGTRIVVDLDTAPRRSRKDDGALVLSF